MIRSKLLYGLECLELTQAEQDKLDAFQIKGLRRILHIPPTHIDRTTTNDMVMEKAAMVLEKLEPITRFSESWQNQKFRLLGHILRDYENENFKKRPSQTIQHMEHVGKTSALELIWSRKMGATAAERERERERMQQLLQPLCNNIYIYINEKNTDSKQHEHRHTHTHTHTLQHDVYHFCTTHGGVLEQITTYWKHIANKHVPTP